MARGRMTICRWVGVIALAGAIVFCAASCKMSDKKVDRLRSKSAVFEVTGTSRVFDRVNTWGDPVGRDAARERSRREASAQVERRIVFGKFRVRQGEFALFRPDPPSYKTVVKEDTQKGDLYRTTMEVFISHKAFPDREGWVRMRHLHSSGIPPRGSPEAKTKVVNDALEAFVWRASAVRYGRTAQMAELEGDIRAIVIRQQTFGNVCKVEIEGVVRFDRALESVTPPGRGK